MSQTLAVDSRESVPTWRIWLGLLALAAIVLAFVTYTRGWRRSDGHRGANYPGVGVPLKTIQLEPLTGDAEPIRTSELLGKVTLIDFWGTWCPMCLEEMPHVLDLQRKFGTRDDFRLILATYDSGQPQNVEGMRESATAYFQRLGASQATHYDPNLQTLGALARDANLSNLGLPICIVLDQRGVLRGLWLGYYPGDDRDVERLITELLK